MERMISEVAIAYYDYPLLAGQVIERGHIVAVDSTGSVVRATGAAGQLPIGIAMNTVVAADGVKPVTVKFWREIWAAWWDNDSAAPITIAKLWQAAYVKDSHTVTLTGASGAFALGAIVNVDANQGVLVHSDYPFQKPVAAAEI